jgi:hypothetical protein
MPTLSELTPSQAAAVEEFARAYVLGDVPSPPAVVECSDSTVLVGGDAGGWSLGCAEVAVVPGPHHEVPDPQVRARRLAGRMAASSGGGVEVVEASPGEFTLLVELPPTSGAYLLELPVRCDDRRTSLGCTTGPGDAGADRVPLAEQLAARSCGLEVLGATARGTLVVTVDGTRGTLRRA